MREIGKCLTLYRYYHNLITPFSVKIILHFRLNYPRLSISHNLYNSTRLHIFICLIGFWFIMAKITMKVHTLLILRLYFLCIVRCLRNLKQFFRQSKHSYWHESLTISWFNPISFLLQKNDKKNNLQKLSNRNYNCIIYSYFVSFLTIIISFHILICYLWLIRNNK